MRQILNIAVILAGMMVAPCLKAITFTGTITLSAPTGTNQYYRYDDGGEFHASTTPNNHTGNLGSFNTFCVDVYDSVSLGKSYNYTTASSFTHKVNGVNESVYLTAGAAWLFQEFATGVLPGYFVSGNTSANHYAQEAHAGELQAAIWYFTGYMSKGKFVSEVNSDGKYAGIQKIGGINYNFENGSYASIKNGQYVNANPYFLDVINHFGSISAAEEAYTYSGSGPEVAFLNLTTSSGSQVQSQLVLIPASLVTTNGGGGTSVPDGGKTAALLIIALIGIGFFARVSIVQKNKAAGR